MGACGTTCLKILVITFNILVAIIGAAILTAGILFKKLMNDTSKDDLDPTTNSVVWYMSVVIIVIGSIVLATAIIGILGAVFQNVCALVCYSIIMVLITLIIAGIGGLTLWLSLATDNLIKGELNKLISKDSSIRQQIEQMQEKRQCCGIFGYKDWELVGSEYPKSCCSGKVSECNPQMEQFHKTGCYEIGVDISNYIRIIGISFLSVAAVQLLIVILSYVLMCSKREDHYSSGQVFALQTRSHDNRAFQA
ncbi:tetraspanin D107-like protein [Leptotrombidium deliense]|uniref:Tetraspanin n=1 Tax=Leptotrombidium deliense TaxID=299467 RepID=A0A443SHY3_9ACAR|nr:tetraspanin D107-like protein [Leptotrombidium deliense]